MEANTPIFFKVMQVVMVFFFCSSVLTHAEPSADNSISSEHSFAEHELHAKQDSILVEKYLADISIHTPQELFDILARADELLERGIFSY